MPSSRANRQTATIAVQTALGGFFFALYALASILIFDEDLARVIATALPYFIFFELGVLSRYVPGVKTAAGRMQ
jgi:hypothetical protein